MNTIWKESEIKCNIIVKNLIMYKRSFHFRIHRQMNCIPLSTNMEIKFISYFPHI